MIIDSFIYYNEQKLAELRIEELKNVVDLTLIFSGLQTFRNNPNDYKFSFDNLGPELDGKVRWICINLPGSLDPWENERFLRQYVSRYVQKMIYYKEISPKSRIIFSDVDEIPSAESVASITGDNFYNFKLDEYYYNFNYPHGYNASAYSCLVRDFNNADDLRYDHLRDPSIDTTHIFNAGWHLSCFGDEEFISNKLKNFSHWELDTQEWTDPAKIRDRMNRKVDIIERGEEHFRVEHTTPLPRPVRENPDNYKEWL